MPVPGEQHRVERERHRSEDASRERDQAELLRHESVCGTRKRAAESVQLGTSAFAATQPAGERNGEQESADVDRESRPSSVTVP